MSVPASAASARELLVWARDQLAQAGIDSPQVDARLLLLHTLNIQGHELALAPVVTAEERATFEALVAKRCQRIPLQRIVGHTGFRFLDIEVAPGVFVPRPETEAVLDPVIAHTRQLVASGLESPQVMDLCCGSGVMGLAVAQEVPQAAVSAVDLNEQAVAATLRNAARNGISNLGAQVVGVEQVPAEFADRLGSFDVVVANPPYIPRGALPRDIEVREHDPHEALYGGGDDGLDIPRVVVAVAAKLLKAGGRFWMEHGDEQGGPCRQLLTESGAFSNIATGQDLTGRDRFVYGQRR